MGSIGLLLSVALVAGLWLGRGAISKAIGGIPLGVADKAAEAAAPLVLRTQDADVEAFVAVRTLRDYGIANKNAQLVSEARACGRALFDEGNSANEIK